VKRLAAGGAREPGFLLLAALFLGALALRPQLVGVGPLLPEIDDDLGVSHAVAGLLGTIPVLCMGLFAPPAAYVAARLGTRAAIGACLAGIAAFGLARAAAPGAPLVLALTIPIGVGMGLAGALMPVAVKERFAHRPAFASGVYTTGINLGSALSSALAVPIAAAWGGWRAALAVFSACTILFFAGWLVFTPPARERAQPAPPRLPWGRTVVWGLAAVFALQSIVYYGLVSWMPDSFQERGWSDEAAGALLGVMSVAALPSGLLVPYLADRGGSRRQWLALCAGALMVATIGIAAVPDGGWAWATLAGLGIGATFPLTMTLPLDVAHGPGDTGAVVGLMLGAGYTITAVGPIALGAVRDATGSFSASLWVLVAVAAAFVASVLPLSPTRLRPAERLEPEALTR
jgi:MFS transporter, CP family, cyanate transporter